MRSTSSLVALACTVALHLGLITAVVRGLSDSADVATQQEPLKVALLQPAPAAAPAQSAPAAAAPPAPDKRAVESKPRPLTKPEAPLRSPAAESTRSTEPPADTAPSASASNPMISAAPHIAVGPTAPPTQSRAAPPARTSASEAAYAGSNRPPPHPRLSIINGEQGQVILRVLVKADGTAGAVEVMTSSGFPRLDESARTTVQTWRFIPATVDGKPVSEWYQVPITFKLKDN